MTRLALVADDLSGALDTAAPFAAHGLSTVVALAPDAIPQAFASGADVVAVSTGSRERSPEAAAARVATAIDALAARAPDLVFLKIDSRLKGHVAADLAAMRAGFRCRTALVAPAIPDLGRVVRGGRVEGFGVPAPIDIAVRLGPAADGATIVDAERDADLVHALGRALDTAEPPLLVGARGLARALALRLGGEKPAAAPPLGRPILVVIGSTDPITVAQVAALRAALPEAAAVAAPDGVVPEVTGAPGGALLVHASDGGAAVSGAVVAARLAAGVVRLAATLRPAALVLSGGETAQATLDALGVGTLIVRGEALPGIAHAEAAIAGRPVAVLTKSGGFGGPDTLVDLVLSSVPVRARPVLAEPVRSGASR
ncbi:four-carbon acid sugar kinase family protein [Prosthecomicrobium pneumaticum]|uniref:Uncharacterized protein YgbK (DUF1537 family) n=1 Tax=Prosthecomicrobium pneumaticum TaxID=81895 RepID=A0A7W9CTZ0_9HYPH|nr:four-carbon acid sugar kinase family protein [Prosthecomicrobium pneumaticum]MBB5751837.1 uncharacterized protein YgbK (DUF1537 family) [Prosthecomicrobium pneumaticum]